MICVNIEHGNKSVVVKRIFQYSVSYETVFIISSDDKAISFGNGAFNKITAFGISVRYPIKRTD